MARRNPTRAFIKAFRVPNVGEVEIFYHRDNKYFFVNVDGVLISGPTEAEVEKKAREHIDTHVALEWRRILVIDAGDIGESAIGDPWGDGPLERVHSMQLRYWRVEVAASLDPKRPGRIQRRFHEDKCGDGRWSEEDERRWVTGLSARAVFESERYIEFPYDPELWDALERMSAVLNRQREALGRLLSNRKTLGKLLLAQRDKLPALPAPKKRRQRA